MKYYLAVFILITLHFVILINIQFTAWPEMFSYPYLLSNGFKLYQDIALPYQPVLPFILEKLYKFFGYNLSVLQAFTWFVILINDILIFLISIRLIGKKLISLVPLAVYVLFQPLTEGNMLWFDLATTPFILLGVLLLLFLKNYKNFFWFGFFLSLSFFIKQQTGILYLLLIIYLIFKKKFNEVFYIFAGSIVPIIFVLFYILLNGTLKDYIFWTIEVPLIWYPRFPGYINSPSIQDTIIIALLFTPIILAALKLLKEFDIAFGVTFFLFLGAFTAAFPRFEFFRFQPALILYIVLLVYILPSMKQKVKILIISAIVLSMALLLKANLHLFGLPTRFYGEREVLVSQKIKQIVEPSDKIFILNEHSLFYVLGGFFPPKPWVDNYVWYMEIEGIQDKVIEGFKKDPPRLILRKPTQNGNWYDLRTYEPKKITEYIQKNYEKVDNIDKDLEIWERH